MAGIWSRVQRFLTHRWIDVGDAHQALPRAALERLERRIAASEQRHTGEVCICVEAALPASYLLRDATARERAVAMFGKLRVWDTEHNNGVLIYLLLAEHAIELVADRGLNRHVDAQRWHQVVEQLRNALRAGQYEDGLTTALEEVSAVLVQHFPARDGAGGANALPNRIDIR
ncbi:TPM domain-containing protein [Pseudorhodoferax soli]|uniref:TLP18.3/Psb32/MOLO-1 phosphatase superfamily protein n=1 Tax=Pseudorhodoferax soli TaxID=545864 RepID=A0A368Y2Z0_9BURK|nr:TPM domain-containing protein [Pseudorhodoferax soli]RCW74670.1 TLP18.3/Psb32/MOLO-1 phosphatase superfamily protein [Pseudorhodoferax soli]